MRPGNSPAHFRQAEVLFEDKRGGSFPDLKAAWEWAQADARAMLQEGGMRAPADQLWIEIHNHAGTIVATLPFVKVVH